MVSAKRSSVRPTADEVAAGTVIAGKYRLDTRLGSGGMGTVWSCTHLVLGERMAVKIVSTSTALSPEVRSRFAREARAAARLKSRFSVQVFDSGELPHGTPYIVMEYLEGETLRERLRRVTRLMLSETVAILAQVARGLQRAHEAGIIHRDIKPDNIFLAHTSDDGVVAKVFDFGVVKLMDAAHATETVEGTFVGTPQFMSPEQAMGQSDVDARTDIYSLGVLAYRMLTGQPVYDTSSITALLMQICNGPLPKIRDLLPDLPPAVEDWFQRTCARDRENRYGSAVECIEALLVAAGMSSSKLSLPDSISSSGLRNYHSGAVRVRDLPEITPGPANPDRSFPPTGASARPTDRRAAGWRRVALVVGIVGVVVTAALLWWPHERGTNGGRTPSAPLEEKAAAAVLPPSAPSPANMVPSDETPSAPPPSTARPSSSSRAAVPAAQPPRPQLVAPKRFDPLPPAATSQGAKGANSAITDVGY